MPYYKRKKFTRRRARRRFRKYSKKGFDKSLIQYAPTGGIPRKLATVLRYHDFNYFENLSTQATATTWQFRLNNLYDPAVAVATGRNGQPAGYDLLSTMYNYYQVKAVAIEAEININTDGATASANPAQQLRIAGSPYMNEGGSNNDPVFPEEVLGGKGRIVSEQGGVTKMRWFIPIKRIAAQAGPTFASGMGALFGSAGPGQPVYFSLNINAVGDTAAAHYCNALISLEFKFYVVCSGPKTTVLEDT